MTGEVDPRWLEAVLERHERERRVEKVLEVNQEACVAKGDNYASDISRVTMKVLLGSGETATRSVIVKAVPSTEHRAKHITQWGIFRKEIKMFNEILPAMHEVLKETEDYYDPLWGDCLYYKPYNLLVLEDLKEYGFKMGSRFVGLDLEHATLAVKELARFHAASIVLKDKGLIAPSEMEYALLKTDDVEMMQVFHDRSFGTLADVIETTWEPEWKYYADGLRAMKGTSVQKWKDCMELRESKMNVLNHGDYWLNNMMFKHQQGTGTPVSFRMLDFQMCFYNSLAFDWLYFTNTTVSAEVLEGHHEELLQLYQASLARHMARLGLEESRIPSLEEVRQEVRDKSEFGLMISCFLMPVMKTDPEDVMDVEDILKKVDAKQEVDLSNKQYLGKSFTQTLKRLLPGYRELGLI